MLPFALPGTPDFLPSILTHVRAISSSPALIDYVILHSILICLIAGDKHLLLRTQEDDIPLVTKLVTQTLSSVFALSTHRVKFRDEPTSTANLLRAFFLPSTSPLNNEFLVGVSNGKFHSPKRRSVSGTSLFTGKPKHSYKQSRPTTFTRSASSPSALTDQPTPSWSSYALSVATAPSSPSTHLGRTSLLRHSQSDQDEQKSDANKAIALPEALVVSGLEQATVTAQRLFLRVLTEKKVTLESEIDGPDSQGPDDMSALEDGPSNEGGMWNLPKGFFVVYVCNFDPREAPKIHRTLLDQFAMSATVNLQPSTRQAIRNFHHHHASPSPPLTPSGSLTNPQSHTSSPSLLPVLLPKLRQLHGRTLISPKLSLYLSDLFSAVRHHHLLDGTFVTARARRDADVLVRAARLIGRDLTGIEVIRSVTGPRKVRDVTDTEVGWDIQNAMTKEALGFGDKGDNESDGTKSPRPVHSPAFNNECAWNATLDVSEADVARIVPRVLSHRLGVRLEPEDELLGSILFGAVKGHREKDQERKRNNVKDNLIRILAEV